MHKVIHYLFHSPDSVLNPVRVYDNDSSLLGYCAIKMPFVATFASVRRIVRRKKPATQTFFKVSIKCPPDNCLPRTSIRRGQMSVKFVDVRQILADINRLGRQLVGQLYAVHRCLVSDKCPRRTCVRRSKR